MESPDDVEAILEEMHIDGEEFRYVDVENRGADDTAYSNRFHPEQGVMVCMENIKSPDKNQPERRLWPSEIIWQSFLHAAAHEGEGALPSGLRLIFRHCVINEQILMTILQASKASNSASHQATDKGYRMYTEGDEGFYAQLGSVNGASTVRMLLDYKHQIGYRTVHKIVVQECEEVEEVKDVLEARTFCVFLSKCRDPSQDLRIQ